MAIIVGFGGADHPGTVSTMIDPDVARELSRAAKQAETWRERRDRLIVEALTGGAGVREVARLVGLSHPSVLHIQKRETTGGTSEPTDL